MCLEKIFGYLGWKSPRSVLMLHHKNSFVRWLAMQQYIVYSNLYLMEHLWNNPLIDFLIWSSLCSFRFHFWFLFSVFPFSNSTRCSASEMRGYIRRRKHRQVVHYVRERSPPYRTRAYVFTCCLHARRDTDSRKSFSRTCTLRRTDDGRRSNGNNGGIPLAGRIVRRLDSAATAAITRSRLQQMAQVRIGRVPVLPVFTCSYAGLRRFSKRPFFFFFFW